MKNIINIKTILSALVLSMGLLGACRDESVLVYDPAVQGVLGFYAYMVDAPPASVTVAEATSTATYKFTPQVVGAQESEVQSFDISVELANSDGTTFIATVALGSITSFPTGTYGNKVPRPEGTITFTAAQVNTALGNPAYVAKQIIVFHEKLTVKNRGFIDESNVNLNLSTVAYKSPFIHQVTVKP